VFLNSPYRETPKTVLKKKVKKQIFWGWLVPRKLIKYTQGSVIFVFECPLRFLVHIQVCSKTPQRLFCKASSVKTDYKKEPTKNTTPVSPPLFLKTAGRFFFQQARGSKKHPPKTHFKKSPKNPTPVYSRFALSHLFVGVSRQGELQKRFSKIKKCLCQPTPPSDGSHSLQKALGNIALAQL
jgi:hypothetical protein